VTDLAPDDPRLAPLPRAFYDRPPTEVGPELLGRYLVRDRDSQPALIARLVEVEAYIGGLDRASHSSRGLTRRTAPMFEEPGHAYIYLIYGMYWCINAVTESPGVGSAVLIRGAEPIQGLDQSTTGPGRLCRAFGLDGSWNRTDLTSSPLRITEGAPAAPSEIETSPRIGVAYAGEWAERPFRYFIRGNPHVSRVPASKRSTKGPPGT
jgi:DNA-3-methyladenine glycosylase